jgi:hypothetical protein
MSRIERLVSFFEHQWLVLLIWFFIGFFVFPMVLSIGLDVINLNDYMLALLNFDVSLLYFSISFLPYLLYQAYRIFKRNGKQVSATPANSSNVAHKVQ